MSNYIHIYLNTSEDAMVGSAGWNGYDEKDSINAEEIAKINRKHLLHNPVGTGGITSGTATCSCGAKWDVFYSRNGMEWEPLNEKCASHDADMAKLPQEDW